MSLSQAGVMNKPSEISSAHVAENHGAEDRDVDRHDVDRHIDGAETLSLTHGESIGGDRASGETDHRVFYPGELVAGRFSIVGFIGHGGMGEVYEAVDQELGQRVAVKTLRSGSASSETRRELFRQEILLARQVTHPNVCRIFDLCYHTSHSHAEQRLPLLSMELLPGENLASHLRRQAPLEPSEVRDLAVDIIRGLSAAHEAGVVHCDLKSSNVMLVPHQDEGARAVVMDFGLASTSSAESMLSSGVRSASGSRAVGTPAYMAPELLRGEPATPASDIYSLGVVLHEMLVGERPRAGQDVDVQVAGRPLDSFWRSVLVRCLAADPTQRFPTADALLAELDDTGTSSRRFFFSLATGAALMLLLALAVYLGLASHPAESPELPEMAESTLARPALAILKFHNLAESSTGQENWFGAVLPELLGSKLASSGQLRWVPRETLQRLGLDRDTAPPTRDLTDVRDATGADYVLSGDYSLLSDLELSGDALAPVEVALVLHDTRTDKVALTVRLTGDSGDLTSLIDGLAREVHNHLQLPLFAAAASTTRLPTSAAQSYAEGLEELDAFRPQVAVSKLRSALAADESFLLARIALIRAYLELGELVHASSEIQLALSSQSALPRDVHLTLAALAAEAVQDWDSAYSAWDALWAFFPDEVEYGLGVVRAFLETSRGAEALGALERLRSAAPHLAADPRIDLAEARAAGQAGGLELQLAAARQAEEKARRFGSLLLQARARLEASDALRATRSIDDALEEARQARGLFEKSEYRPGVAEALLAESVCLRHQGAREGSIERAVAAQRIYRELGYRRGVAEALKTEGDVLYWNEPHQARALYERAQQTYEEMGNQARIAAAVHNIGLTYMSEKEYNQAFDHYRQALALFRKVKHPEGESQALNSLGFYYKHAERDIYAASDAFEQSLAIKRRINDRSTSTTTLANLGNLYLRMGSLAKAETHLAEALELAQELENYSRQAVVLRDLAQVRLYQDRLDEAEDLTRRALAMRRANGSKNDREQWMLARVHLEQDQFEKVRHLATGLMDSEDALSREQGRLLRAEVLTRQGHLEGAVMVLEQLDIQLDDADWTDLLIRSRRLLVRHLALGGHLSQGLALNRSIEELAGRNTFKVLELEIVATGCKLEPEPEVARLCWNRARRAAEPLGLDLIVRRIDEARHQGNP